MKNKRKQVRKNETFPRCSENSQHCYHPLGITILSFAEDDKLRSGEDVTSATGMTKISMKNSKCAMSKLKKKVGRPSRYKRRERSERKERTRGERARNGARARKNAENDERMQEDREISKQRLSECCAISCGSQQHPMKIARDVFRTMA